MVAMAQLHMKWCSCSAEMGYYPSSVVAPVILSIAMIGVVPAQQVRP